MNIAKNEISGTCKLKCAYNFNYPITSCNVLNSSSGIKVEYDKLKIPPVMYNGNKYTIENVTVTTQKLAYFQNILPLALIKVEHNPIAEGNPLTVIIPITIGNSRKGGTLITELINETIRQIPKNGTTVLNINNFTANTIVPSAPYYASEDTDNNRSYIFFDLNNSIQIREETMNKLYADKYGSDFLTNPDNFYNEIREDTPDLPKRSIYYNSAGPNSLKTKGNGGKDGDDIYIECNPVNESDEVVQMKMPTLANSPLGFDIGEWFDVSSVKDLFSKTWVQVILSFLGFLLLFGIITWVLRYIKPKSPSNVGEGVNNGK